MNQNPNEWADAERIANLPAVHEVIQGFAQDPTGDHGTMIVREVLRVQAGNEPVAAAIVQGEIAYYQVKDGIDWINVPKAQYDRCNPHYRRVLLAAAQPPVAPGPVARFDGYEEYGDRARPLLSVLDAGALIAGAMLYVVPPVVTEITDLAARQLIDFIHEHAAVADRDTLIGEVQRMMIGAVNKSYAAGGSCAADIALGAAAQLAIKETALPRDMLGAPSPQRKAVKDAGLRIAAKIQALKGGAA